MDVSILIARIVGPLFVVAGLGVVLNPSAYRDMMRHFLENPSLYYFSGAAALVTGIVIILYHNLWVADWRVAITVIGWLSLVKGAVRLLLPNAGRRIAKPFSESAGPLLVGGVLILAAGCWLAWEGYRTLGG